MARLTSYLRAHFASLASVGIRGLSVLAGFVITFYIGRSFGPLANGQYALVAQSAMFLSIVAVGGMDLAVVRHFSATIALGRPLAPRALLRAIGYSLGVALLIAAVLAIGGEPLLLWLFDKDLPRDALLLLCLMMIARTGTRVMGAILRSQDAHLRGQAIEVLVIPGGVSLLLLLHVLHRDVTEVLWATALIGLAAAAYGIVSVASFTRRRRDAVDVSFATLFRTSIPLWATALALNLNDWYSLATAATTLGVYDAGLFRIAFQIGGALSFAAMGMYNVFTARISAALAADDRERVAKLSRACSRLAAVCVLPAGIALAVVADPLLRFVHPEFVQAVPLLRVVVLGQVLYVLTGPAGLVLAMTGHERKNFAISAATTVALLILAPMAAHMYGLMGLAIVTAIVPLAGNIANLVAVRRLEGINVVTGHLDSRLD